MATPAQKLSHWLIPPGVRDLERRWRRLRERRRVEGRYRALLAPNAALRDLHAGRRCFILGNGPSLARQELASLAGEITFAASGFFKHPIVDRWQPTYYAFADPLFFDGSQSTRDFFEALRARIQTPTFLVPAQARDAIERDGVLPLDQTRFLAFAGQLANGVPGSIDLTRAVPGINNVVLLAIMAAMYAGCSPIYLLGLDHDWLAHRGPDRHFYAGKTLENHAQAHANLAAYGYRELMENALELWKSYEVLRALADARGTRIYNATDGGFLDVFERARYEDVIATPDAGRARPG